MTSSVATRKALAPVIATVEYAPDARRRPVLTAWIPLKLEGYPDDGLGAHMRTNPPMHVYDALGTGEWRGVLRSLIVDWTLVDDNGQPVALDDGMTGATKDELLGLLSAYYEHFQERVTLPKQNASG